VKPNTWSNLRLLNSGSRDNNTRSTYNKKNRDCRSSAVIPIATSSEINNGREVYSRNNLTAVPSTVDKTCAPLKRSIHPIRFKSYRITRPKTEGKLDDVGKRSGLIYFVRAKKEGVDFLVHNKMIITIKRRRPVSASINYQIANKRLHELKYFYNKHIS